MDYTTLSLVDMRAGLDDVARDTERTFGGLDPRQLNWRPDATRWSVAQCFEHLVTANRLIVRAAQEALDDTRPRTVWQRLPGLPGFWGRMLVRSQSPESARKYKASHKAQPATSGVGAVSVPGRIARISPAPGAPTPVWKINHFPSGDHLALNTFSFRRSCTTPGAPPSALWVHR